MGNRGWGCGFKKSQKQGVTFVWVGVVLRVSHCGQGAAAWLGWGKKDRGTRCAVGQRLDCCIRIDIISHVSMLTAGDGQNAAEQMLSLCSLGADVPVMPG